MSRLYVTKESDMSKGGSRASKRAAAEIRWGSSGDSKLAARIEVEWDKKDKLPKIKVVYGNEWADELIEEIILKR